MSDISGFLEEMKSLIKKRDSDSLSVLVHAAVYCLVDHPEEVNIVEMRGQRNVVFEIHVAEADHKFLLGANNAQNIHALRLLAMACARKLRIHVAISDVPSRTRKT
jgi:predicted RNA-binding protein YlqC (UPF0109 family)